MNIRRNDLHKLDCGLALDAITKTNQTLQPVEVVAVIEPLSETFVGDKQEGALPDEATKLDELIQEIQRKPKRQQPSSSRPRTKHLLDP